eukprot:6457674-Amphidinium_carterae.1
MQVGRLVRIARCLRVVRVARVAKAVSTTVRDHDVVGCHLQHGRVRASEETVVVKLKSRQDHFSKPAFVVGLSVVEKFSLSEIPACSL